MTSPEPAVPSPPERGPDPSNGRASARRRLLWTGTAFVWIAAGGLYLTFPPGPDQFNHAYMGWRWLHGEVPYRDVVDMNWPGVMGLHAIGAALFGIRSWSWHLMDFLLLAGSGGFLFDLARRGFGRAAGWTALLLYPLFYVILPNDFAGQHDMTGTQFLVGCLWFHVRSLEERSWKRALAAGAFLGAAMLNKPTLGCFGLLMPLHAFLVRTPWKSVLVLTGAAAGASIAVILLGFGAVVAAGAPLRDVLDCAVRYNAAVQFSESAPAGAAVSRFLEVHVKWWPANALLAAVSAVASFRSPRRSPASTALPMLWIAGVGSFAVQARAYPYHLAPCFVAVAGLAAASIPLVGTLSAGRLASRARLVLPSVAAVLILGIGIFKAGRQYRAVPGALFSGDWSVHESLFEGGQSLTFAELRSLADDVKRAVPEHEPVLVLGSVSAVNVLAQRAQPTRFYYAWVLYYLKPSMPMAARWTELWRRDLETGKPRWCLIPADRLTDWMSGSQEAGRVLGEYLKGHGYTRARHLGGAEGFDLYVRP